MSSPLADSNALDDRQIPQLRISARVQNKQKKDENVQIANDALASATTDCNAQADDEDEDERDPNQASNDDDENNFKRGKKRRRAWELWSVEDKKVFFDAINECGKDFDGIQNHLVTKLKKKGCTSSVIKNKDQVRHFYYRTWHKISKYISFNNDLKKATQELYALINYGELRRKVGGTLDEKKGQKLQELIQKGSTSVRIKGKSIRIRTPICRALKKLNEFQDERDSLGTQVPTNIQVDLVPINMQSWNHVQSLAHNPRVRISCPTHKPITDVIAFVQNKWRKPRLKIRDSMVPPNTLDSASIASTSSDLLLRLRPPTDVVINRLNVKLDSQVKSYAVSLLSHEELLQKKDPKKERNRKASNAIVKSPSPVLESNKYPEEGEISQEETEGSDLDEEQRTYDQLIKEEPATYFSNSDDDDDETARATSPDNGLGSSETLHQLKALQTVADSNYPDEESEVVYVGQSTGLIAGLQNSNKINEDECCLEDEKPDEEASAADISKQSLDSDVARIRDGWTVLSKSASTVGELYLMLGSNLKICLEYDFVDPIDIPDTQLDCNSPENSTKLPGVQTELSKSPTSVSDDKVLSPSDSSKVSSLDIKVPDFKSDASTMMNRLLGLIRSISTNPDACFCGGPRFGVPNGLQSPLGAAARLGRSPSSHRSPRTLSASEKSPRTPTSSGVSRGPGLEARKHKPASAKRLIPADIGDKLQSIDSQPKQDDLNSKSESDLNRQSSETEFRVPVGPAPRTICQPSTSSSFNSQLTKLLPRYSNPTRRTNRKNLLVKRQLPLLPKTPQPTTGFVTFKVLPQHTPIEMPTGNGKPPVLGIALATKPEHSTSIMQNKSLPDQPLIVSNSYLQGTSSLASSCEPNNAISVNVSGRQLLTVEMPVNVSAPISFPTTTTDSRSALLPTTFTTLSLPNAPLTVPSTPVPICTTSIDSALCFPLTTSIGSQVSAVDSTKESPMINYDSCDSLGTLLTQTLASGTGSDGNYESRTLETPTDFENVFSSAARDELSSHLSLQEYSNRACSTITCTESGIVGPSDQLNTSLLTTPPRVVLDSPMKDTSMAKLNLSSLLSVPQMHLPDMTSNSSTEINVSVTCLTTTGSTTQSATMMSTNHQHPFQDSSCDKLLDITLASSNSNSSFSSLLAAAVGPLEPLESEPRSSVCISEFDADPHSPPSSPSRLLRQTDSQWLHTDPNDFSLSSLLGTMESPVKNSSGSTDGGSLPPSLLSALNDTNTVDFTTTFANLKKQTKENRE